MKKILATFFALALSFGAFAQTGNDTMYVVKKGKIVYGFATKDVDSIIFYRASGLLNPPKDTVRITDTVWITEASSVLGTVSFATNTTWVVGSQTWSDAVQTTVCSGKTSFDGGTSDDCKIDCRSNPGRRGDLFSGEMVNKYKDSLCPAPWRVPTRMDFVHLDQALGGTGGSQYSSTVRDAYLNTWGGDYFGECDQYGSLSGQGSYVYFWSQSENGSCYAHRLHFKTNNFICPQGYESNRFGFPVRCVR